MNVGVNSIPKARAIRKKLDIDNMTLLLSIANSTVRYSFEQTDTRISYKFVFIYFTGKAYTVCTSPNVYSNLCNHTIFRYANFIGCLSADKIKMPVRKYFCFNIPVYRNMAEEPSCRSPYHEEYIQTSASGSPEGLCHSTCSFLSERR